MSEAMISDPKFQVGDQVRRVYGRESFTNRGATHEVRAAFRSRIEGRSIFYAIESVAGIMTVQSEKMLRAADSQPRSGPPGRPPRSTRNGNRSNHV